MKVYKKGYMIVIVPEGATKKDYIPAMHTRMEFSGDNMTVYIRDIVFSSSYTSKTGGTTQETFSCLVAELENEAGDLVGNLAAVETYLCGIIGS